MRNKTLYFFKCSFLVALTLSVLEKNLIHVYLAILDAYLCQNFGSAKPKINIKTYIRNLLNCVYHCYLQLSVQGNRKLNSTITINGDHLMLISPTFVCVSRKFCCSISPGLKSKKNKLNLVFLFAQFIPCLPKTVHQNNSNRNNCINNIQFC